MVINDMKNLREECRKAAKSLAVKVGDDMMPYGAVEAANLQSHIDIAVNVAVELSKRLYRYHSDAVSTAVDKELKNLIQELKGELDG